MPDPERVQVVANEANQFMYGVMTRIFTADSLRESPLNRPSLDVSQEARAAVSGFKALGVDENRIRVISALANIDAFSTGDPHA